MGPKSFLIRDVFLYALGFILLLEWLYPVPYITNGSDIPAFITIAGLFFLVTLVRLPMIVSLLLRVVIIIGALYWLFPPEPGSPDSWFTLLARHLFENSILVLSGNVVELSALFRTFLFIVLLSILSYLLHYWIIHARKILLFLILSIIYVGAIDSFTDYDGNASIVRMFVVGLILFVTLRVLKNGEGNTAFSFARLGKVMALSSVLILTAAAISFVMPKPEPQWSDPVPYLESILGFSSGGTPTQRIGYSEDDSRLGGGFVDDDTPVFYARIEEGSYWKGETKNVYTGSGWELSLNDTNETLQTPPLQEGERTAVIREEREAQLRFYGEGEQRFNHLFYPGELVSSELELMNTGETEPIVIHSISNQATLVDGQAPPNQYEVTYYDQTFQVGGLREDNQTSDLDWELYTEVPDDLPERVRELAEELTEGRDTVYDQVIAIENYLRGPSFSYETEDVPVPNGNQDYVDQFLFETQRGYCDNFSTAMAVMLRTLDIPTRWVKGFTEGQQVEVNDEYEEYLISNNNAHSWVEVYFPSAGWVSFEPTPSFSGFEFEQEQVDSNVDETEEIPVPEDQNDSEEQQEERPEEDVQEDEVADIATTTERGPTGFLVFSSIAFVLIVAIVVFLFRKTFAIRFIKAKQHTAKTVDDYATSFERLMWVLRLYGINRKPHQTLKEYAYYVESELGLENQTMIRLVEVYERHMYSRNAQRFDKKKFDENWKKMLNQITS
ncbi:transglutaminase TgpA family protein [Shouchella lehensis]|uniref:Transglutaminase-like domain-containing protein n=1 Tax=Shouchella lehensis G1 TaxID=1246626 RepID=A0A060LZT3_9BACI|nr:transglutaminaseTgpA domain-containing protein [Shouchella lehensis]AIC95672.1 transglutaminase-like domain-containing protein [Shouchella lehensis G1]